MKLTIISGRSGSGKSTVLHVLEDRGYYCIDNLPASLLPALAARLASGPGDMDNVAVGIDARNISADLERVPDMIRRLQADKLPTEVVFLDADSSSLLRRFSESRRKHPLSSASVGLAEAIDRESELLEPISLLSDIGFDTSGMSLHELRDNVRRRLLDRESVGLALSFLSFGFKNGPPPDADLVYDVRCLPNPHWDRTLRAQTGLDGPVAKFLESQDEVQRMYEDIRGFLQRWLPAFENDGRSYMTVALGCTGGQHRSVYLCQRLAAHFAKEMDNVQVRHRELRGAQVNSAQR